VCPRLAEEQAGVEKEVVKAVCDHRMCRPYRLSEDVCCLTSREESFLRYRLLLQVFEHVEKTAKDRFFLFLVNKQWQRVINEGKQVDGDRVPLVVDGSVAANLTDARMTQILTRWGCAS
jgi:hypothetical protein